MRVRVDKKYESMLDSIDILTNNYLVEMPTKFYKLETKETKDRKITFKFSKIFIEFEEFKNKNKLNNTTLINSILKYHFEKEKEKENEKN